LIFINGSERSGSGTIVRYAVGLTALLGEELALTNIRAKRDNPGLRPQHLRSVEAVAELCGGRVEGARVGSREIRFRGGGRIRGGSFAWDIGTAGSTTMLAMTLLPVACFAPEPVRLRITGGLFQDFAPSALHMQNVLFPILRRMGLAAGLRIIRPGYVPRGGGIIEVEVEPVRGKLRPIVLERQGKVTSIQGTALSSHLKGRRVSHRMAEECLKVLRTRGYEAGIRTVYDESAPQPGAALALYAETDTGCLLGADRAGEPRRTSEEIGRYVARSLLEDLDSGATVDRHLADQLIIYAALAEGESRYLIPRATEHVETNLWLVENILGAEVRMEKNMVIIRGVGYEPGHKG